MGERDPVARAAVFALLGRHGPMPATELHDLIHALEDDPDARVRVAALGALVRGADREAASRAWARAIDDAEAAVRRRAAELAPAGDHADAAPLVDLLADGDVTVVEAAAWALGELGRLRAGSDAVAALTAVARDHGDPLAREAAVAALGALGDPAGLPAVLAACRDRPAVRRRAVLALAPFEGPEVDAAITAALDDRDWQVRQAAEDLSRSSG